MKMLRTIGKIIETCKTYVKQGLSEPIFKKDINLILLKSFLDKSVLSYYLCGFCDNLQ